MSATDLEERVARLEAEVSQMKNTSAETADDGPWWKKVVGIFADDPTFEEAMRLGREYREAQRPPEDTGVEDRKKPMLG